MKIKIAVEWIQFQLWYAKSIFSTVRLHLSHDVQCATTTSPPSLRLGNKAELHEFAICFVFYPSFGRSVEKYKLYEQPSDFKLAKRDEKWAEKRWKIADSEIGGCLWWTGKKVEKTRSCPWFLCPDRHLFYDDCERFWKRKFWRFCERSRNASKLDKTALFKTNSIFLLAGQQIFFTIFFETHSFYAHLFHPMKDTRAW